MSRSSSKFQVALVAYLIWSATAGSFVVVHAPNYASAKRMAN